MAVGKSGYIDVTVMPSSVGKVRVYWREDYDSINNYSTITITDIQGYVSHRTGWADLTLTVKAGDVTILNNNTDWMLSCQADGTFRSVVPRTQWNGKFTPVTSVPIYHNDDGSKTIDITFTLNDLVISSVGFNATNNQSATSTVALTSIPRASTISATDANIEAVSLVVVNRKSSAYTHSIKYQFGSISGYINADGGVSSSEVKLTATNIGFTIPASFYAQIPNAKTGICTLTVKTYSGDTQIGDAKTCTFTVTAERSKSAPSVSGTVVDINETTLALTGNENTLVRFFSTALAKIAATAKNSASIASKFIAGAEVSEDTRTIESVETDSFVFAASDSRGYSGSATVVKSLIPYIKLTANMTVSRDDPTSGKATLMIKGDYFNGSFGAVSNALTVQYRIDSGSWVTITPTLDGNTYIAAAALTDLDYQFTFDFEVRVTDKLMTATKSALLNKGIANFHMGENDVTFEVDVNINKNMNVIQLNIGGKALWEYFMPVGFVYTSSNATSPAELFGGTWEQITDRVIVGAGGSYAVGSTGGEATHTLTVDEMPSHYHKITSRTSAGSYQGYTTTTGNTTSTIGDINTKAEGGGAAHNNMQPYIAKYIWERVE